MIARLAAASLQEIKSTPELLDFARALGRRAFADNCAPCHGAGGGGAKGYPNLDDNKWLWGGKLADIAQTIRHGARAGDDDGHQGSMPAFGRDGMLKPIRAEKRARQWRPGLLRYTCDRRRQDAACAGMTVAGIRRSATYAAQRGPKSTGAKPVLFRPMSQVLVSLRHGGAKSRSIPLSVG